MHRNQMTEIQNRFRGVNIDHTDIGVGAVARIDKFGGCDSFVRSSTVNLQNENFGPEQRLERSTTVVVRERISTRMQFLKVSRLQSVIEEQRIHLVQSIDMPCQRDIALLFQLRVLSSKCQDVL